MRRGERAAGVERDDIGAQRLVDRVDAERGVQHALWHPVGSSAERMRRQDFDQRTAAQRPIGCERVPARPVELGERERDVRQTLRRIAVGARDRGRECGIELASNRQQQHVALESGQAEGRDQQGEGRTRIRRHRLGGGAAEPGPDRRQRRDHRVAIDTHSITFGSVNP